MVKEFIHFLFFFLASIPVAQVSTSGEYSVFKYLMITSQTVEREVTEEMKLGGDDPSQTFLAND